MTNLQQGAPRISARLLRRLWFWAPVAVGALVASLLTAGVLIPQWLAFRQDTERLRQLEALRAEVTLLREQMKVLDQNEEKGEAQKVRLVELFAGRGDPGTFLAMLDREARASGVQLDVFEPQAATPAAPAPTPAPAPPPKANTTTAPPAPSGQSPPPAKPPPPPTPPAASTAPGVPIEIEGMERRTVLITARGSYPALVAFLRRVETLSILVVQNDLNISLDETRSADAKASSAPPPVVMKLAFSLYARPDGAQAGAPATPPR